MGSMDDRHGHQRNLVACMAGCCTVYSTVKAPHVLHVLHVLRGRATCAQTPSPAMRSHTHRSSRRRRQTGRRSVPHACPSHTSERIRRALAQTGSCSRQQQHAGRQQQQQQQQQQHAPNLDEVKNPGLVTPELHFDSEARK
jgi:hypothetical protein